MDVSKFFAVNPNKRKQESVVETYAVDDVVQTGHSFYQIDFIKVVQGRVKYTQTNLDGTQDGTLIENDLFSYNNKIKLSSVEASKVKKISKFVLKYNKYIKYFNSYKDHEVSTIDIHFVYETLMRGCGLTMDILENVLRKIQGCQDGKLSLRNIIIRPFAFIRAEFQLISFEKAEFIDDLFGLNTTFEIKCSVWHFDFIHKYNSFYVEEIYFYQCFEKFCAKKEKEYGTYASILRDSCITQLFKDKRYVTTDALLNIEKQLGDTICDLFFECEEEIDLVKITDCIYLFETHTGSELFEEQRKAVINTISKRLSIITGYPGTGKTTIMECVVFVLKECGYANASNISIIAPTGLAYVQLKKRLDSFNVNKEFSGTCHRALYAKFPAVKRDYFRHKYLLSKSKILLSESESKELLSYKKVDIDLIIIDEFSMVDTFMFSVILEYCVFFKCRLLLVGDNNQLPSIGPGCILQSIIGSGLFNTNICNLSVIHRQEAGVLKENIQQMNTRLLTYDDFDDGSMVLKNINHFLCPKGLSIDPFKIRSLIDEYGLTKTNCKFLSYFRSDKYKFNVGNLNNIVQSKFITVTPKQHIFSRTKRFDVGDIIMRTENDYSDEAEMRANGELAEIVDIVDSKVLIKYHDSPNSNSCKKIDFNELENGFVLAYALTVHKSQGSQFENIVIFIDNAQSCWDKQTLYTAISRASKRCIIVSSYDNYLAAQRRNNNNKLSLFLELFKDFEFE